MKCRAMSKGHSVPCCERDAVTPDGYCSWHATPKLRDLYTPITLAPSDALQVEHMHLNTKPRP